MSPKRNLAVLFAAHAVLGSQMPVNVVLGGLAGAELAANPALATLPLSVIVLFSMFAAPVASFIMGRFGRRAGFLIGALAGAMGGALSAQALFQDRFELLLAGSACTGVFQGFQAFVRFAASDAVPGPMKPKAISWVLAAGLVSALVGPEIVRWLADGYAPTPYAGAYVAVVAINVAGGAILVFLGIPRPPKQTVDAGSRRAVGELLRQPRLIAAVFCGMVAYASMSLVMTPTSLAMAEHGFDANHAADVVRWHVVAMFAPSFFTGSLIGRFGHAPVIATGLALLLCCSIVALAGVDLHHFYIALIVLGIGWNFGFIGATSLLATAHRPEEQAFVQGLNDFLVFGLVAVASFGAGALLNLWGWNAVQYASVPSIALAFCILLWYVRRDARDESGVRAPALTRSSSESRL
ncbi:MAG TPA: MFS transporter [Gammaproteobacteria bacterium]|nr:MFS transporter [Gammaproteobacteria bacterium]